MELVVKHHQEIIPLYEGQVKDGKDKDVKAYAEKTLPVLRDHLKTAQELAGKLKGGDR